MTMVFCRYLNAALAYVLCAVIGVNYYLNNNPKKYLAHPLLATLSFLKLLQHWRNMRFWVWRSDVGPSDAAEKNHNTGAQLRPSRAQRSRIFLKNLHPVSFSCAKNCSFRAFLDYWREIWQLLPALCSDMR